jgi:hypothetical protein
LVHGSIETLMPSIVAGELRRFSAYSLIPDLNNNTLARLGLAEYKAKTLGPTSGKTCACAKDHRECAVPP